MNDLNYLALLKPDGETFLFTYDDQSRVMAMESIRENAADPECSLSLADAATLLMRDRQRKYLNFKGD